jgi:hypothetical protein
MKKVTADRKKIITYLCAAKINFSAFPGVFFRN